MGTDFAQQREVESNCSIHWDVVVVGGANFDYFAQCKELPISGETKRSGLFLSYPSGRGVNQAIAAAKFGARTAYIGKIGKDSRGDLILTELQRSGVNTDFVFRDSNENTGTNLIVADQKGAKQTVSTLGANDKLTKREVLMSAPLLQSTKFLLLQGDVPKEAILASIQLASASDAQVFFTPAPSIQTMAQEFFSLIDIVRMNQREAEALTDVPVFDRNSARIAAEKILWRGVNAVIIQAGNEGNLMLWGEYELWLPKLIVRTVDQSGAGDTFSAAFATSLAEGKSLTEAAIFANAAAALETTHFGADTSHLSKSDVFALLYSSVSKKKQKWSALLKLVS